jgi:MoaA/NifB/PqqE/SkfB family radical SAM enzyme
LPRQKAGEIAMMGKNDKLLIFDNCMIDPCNLACKYCRDKSFEIIGKNVTTTDGVSVDLNKLKDDCLRASLLAQDFFDIPILKVSSFGEFFLLPATIDFLRSVSARYERIQIVTNATRLDENTICRLSEIPGINIGVSLDGHTPELNACRTRNQAIIDKILDNIGILRKYKVPVEINSVLTKSNTRHFIDFVDYLSDRYDHLLCYPFPVRADDGLRALGPENAEALAPLLEPAKGYSRLLPHSAYIKRLLSFIATGKRQDKCYVGYSNLGIDPVGSILVCACNMKKPIANIFAQDPTIALGRRASHPLFYKFFFSRILFKQCFECFPSYEIINLCLDGIISLEEMGQVPLFSGPKTQNRLAELKARLNP